MYNQKNPEMVISEMDIWFSASTNANGSCAKGCKDAASKRYRLGKYGIPLSDELKSNFGSYTNTKGEKHYAIIHCRANHSLDFTKIRTLLGGEFERVEQEELESRFDLAYGLINPFSFHKEAEVLQVFDEEVLKNYLPPYTMMTNIGVCQKAAEFIPQQLVDSLPNTLVADVVVSQETPGPRVVNHAIGILTGNSPESGMLLWKIINENIRENYGDKFSGDLSLPRVLISSIPEMGISMELSQREPQVKQIVLKEISRLISSGASIITIACNTTQFFSSEIKELCANSGVSFISMYDTIEDQLQATEANEFDFIGIESVSDFNQYSAFKALKKKYQINIPEQRHLSEISELAFQVKKEGKVSRSSINRFGSLMNKSCKTDNVIIALTEMSMVLSAPKGHKSSRYYIDTLQVLGQRIARDFFKGIENSLKD